MNDCKFIWSHLEVLGDIVFCINGIIYPDRRRPKIVSPTHMLFLQVELDTYGSKCISR